MPDRYLSRTIHLKEIQYLDAERSWPPIDEIISQLFAATSTAGELHVPAIVDDEEESIEEGTSCSFIDSYHSSASSPGISIRVGSYQVGAVTEAMHPDLSHNRDVVTEALPVIDPSTGEIREIVKYQSVLFWNQIAIVENVRGTGGYGRLESTLRELIRRHIDDDFPAIRFRDVARREIIDSIRRGGGVRQVQMDLATSVASDGGRFSSLLGRASAQMGNVKLARLILRGENGLLPTNGALEAYDEFEEGGLDKVNFELKNGEVVASDQLRVRKTVSIPANGGVISRKDLLKKMRLYLVSLRQSEADRLPVVDDNGTIVRT